MKKYIAFIAGALIGAALLHFFFKPPPQIRTVWKERIVKEPARVDTVQLVKTKYITVPKVVEKTIMVTKTDTLIIRDTVRIVISAFDYTLPEFDLNLQCYSAAKVDSVAMRYKMKEAYIRRLMGSNPPPSRWKNVAWFGAGALFTGSIVYLVK